MIIDYVKGDLFKTPYKYIAHGCNCLGVMGAGVAAIVAKKYPKAEIEYVKALKSTNPPKLGDNIIVDCYDKIIINALTQQKTGRGKQVSYDAIYDCFLKLDMMLMLETTNEEALLGRKLPNPVVAIPKIGAGLAGGNWSAIAAIIDSATPDIDIVVYHID